MDAPSYQTILREELAHRQSRNAGYSLRAFARDLGVGVSTLNEVLHEVASDLEPNDKTTP